MNSRPIYQSSNTPRSRLIKATSLYFIFYTIFTYALVLIFSPHLFALPTNELAKKVLVVYNSDLPVSKSLAAHYAKLRSIPEERLLGLPCSLNETISRRDYNLSLRDPINAYLLKKKWIERKPNIIRLFDQEIKVNQAVSNDIWIIVLIQGIPLRIEEDPTFTQTLTVPEPFRFNRACVDSELSTLPTEGLPVIGFYPNPYFTEKELSPFNQSLANQLILVCRLDGPDPETVIRMMDDALATENLELTGRVYLDSRNIKDPKDPYRIGDQWIETCAIIAQTNGLETELDQEPATVGSTAVWDDAALYFGWYEWNMNGPFLRPEFHFRPGAIAYHIHSFSAETLRSKEKNWAGPLLAKGAAATMGSVYEPYLRFTPDPSTFLRALLNGYTFAEASYQSQAGISWTMTMLGDPLYRPFPRRFLDNLNRTQTNTTPEAPWIYLRTARLIAASQESLPVKLEKISKVAEFARNSPIFLEGYADILSDLKSEPELLIPLRKEAIRLSVGSPNIIRNSLKLAKLYATHHQAESAIKVYETLMLQMPEASRSYDVPKIAADNAAPIAAEKSPSGELITEPLITPTPPPAPALTPFNPAVMKDSLKPNF